MFGGIGIQELLVIFLIVLLLFGAKRIPDIAQGLGRGIRDFKRALKEGQDEITSATNDSDKSAKTNSTVEKKE